MDFGLEGKPYTFEKVGRFQGSLPPKVHENYAGWNASVARAERLTENARAFLRIHADTVDSATQFWIDGGEIVQTVCREVNISEATLYRWKQQYGAMEVDELKELKALRDENARLKRIVADQSLNIQVLKEVNSKKW